MSTAVTNRVWDGSAHSGSKLLTLLAIADNAGDHGVSWPGVKTLAQRARISERALYKVLAALEASGELYTHRRPGQHNVYVVLVGMKDRDHAVAAQTLNQLFPISEGESVTVESLRGTPERTDTSTPEPQFTPADSGTPEPQFTPPLNPSSLPPEPGDSRSNTVVVGSESDPDPDIQQQREPESVERELFQAQLIGEAIWQRWMHHDPVRVVAAILHATNARGVENSVGLMRAMLEHGTSAPASRYVREAEKRLKASARDAVDLEPVGWDPRRADEVDDAVKTGGTDELPILAGVQSGTPEQGESANIPAKVHDAWQQMYFYANKADTPQLDQVRFVDYTDGVLTVADADVLLETPAHLAAPLLSYFEAQLSKFLNCPVMLRFADAEAEKASVA